MLRPISCKGELHPVGGEGLICFSDFNEAEELLLSRYSGAARVVYLDPPFGTGGSFEFRRGKTRLAYTDKLTGEEYRSLIKNAAELSHKLLKDDGTLFLHIDCRMSAVCRLALDEVFGPEAFTNEIIWAYRSGGRSQKSFSKKHDTILMYRKTPEAYFNIEAVGAPRGPQRRNHMKRAMAEDGRMYYAINSGGREYRYYDDDPIYPSDVWDDIEHLHQRDPERTGFITQKPEALLERIILACSEPGDTVVDLFAGSGTTAAAAARLGRRFAAVDLGEASLAVMRSRLIEKSLSRPIYESAKPLEVISRGACEEGYSTGAVLPEALFDITEKGDILQLSLRDMLKDELPYYISTGRVNAGVFHAEDYLADIRPGAKLALKLGECVHIVDGGLKNGFYANE